MTSKFKDNNPPVNYKDAGVDVEAGHKLVETIKPYVAKTKRPEILSGLGLAAVPGLRAGGQSSCLAHHHRQLLL